MHGRLVGDKCTGVKGYRVESMMSLYGTDYIVEIEDLMQWRNGVGSHNPYKFIRTEIGSAVEHLVYTEIVKLILVSPYYEHSVFKEPFLTSLLTIIMMIGNKKKFGRVGLSYTSY